MYHLDIVMYDLDIVIYDQDIVVYIYKNLKHCDQITFLFWIFIY